MLVLSIILIPIQIMVHLQVQYLICLVLLMYKLWVVLEQPHILPILVLGDLAVFRQLYLEPILIIKYRLYLYPLQ
ncbi:MAG: hypothetical protein CL557_17835 [Alphaproteobacteria bacterium]|nr:hypothetical protein [Alphaproteobacteria bacterium]